MDFFSDANLLRVFLKAFFVVLSILFLLYALVLERQTVTMIGTVRFKGSAILVLVARIQIFVSIALLLIALLFL